eukprot:4093882-Pyramimonas_sp.AAC.1
MSFNAFLAVRKPRSPFRMRSMDLISAAVARGAGPPQKKGSLRREMSGTLNLPITARKIKPTA